MTEKYAIGHYFKRLLVAGSLYGSARHHLDEVVSSNRIAHPAADR